MSRFNQIAFDTVSLGKIQIYYLLENLRLKMVGSPPVRLFMTKNKLLPTGRILNELLKILDLNINEIISNK